MRIFADGTIVHNKKQITGVLQWSEQILGSTTLAILDFNAGKKKIKIKETWSVSTFIF